MADLAQANVVVVVLDHENVNSRSHLNLQLSFGDGALTYPAGGIPLSRGKLGCPNIVEQFKIYDKAGSAYDASYDNVNQKVILRGHSHDLKVIGGQAATTTNEIGAYASATLGKEEVANVSFLGVDAATKGGVLPRNAGVEPSAVAIVAQTLKVEVIGW